MGLLKLFHFTSMYFMSLCYVLAQSKVLGKGEYSISVELFIFCCHLCWAGQEFVRNGPQY
jgi:hypothetical protein